MSIEIPYDLIKQVQIAVLKEGNLSSYDPNDPSLPNLPSFESSFSELHPSPPNLRCQHCKGILLRGLNSIICVFCGKPPAEEDAPPEPINLKDTFGCRWLLESLNLDESEVVSLPVKENDTNRGHNTSQEEFPLSHLLDLEIKCHSEFEQLEAEGSINLAGINLDKFFAEGKRATVSAVSEEQSKPNNGDDDSGDSDFQVRDTLSMFENVQRSDTGSAEVKSDGCSFDGWEANFQSSASGTSHEESKSSDPVVGSSDDLSAHMDAVFGPGKGFFDGSDQENKVSSAANTNERFQDDLWSSSSSGISGQAKQMEVATNVKDGRTMENANSSSMSIDWIQDYKAPSNKTIDEEDDSFDVWNDFTRLTTTKDPSNKQTNQAQQFEVTAIVKDGEKVENPNNSSSRSVDWVQEDQLKNKSTKAADNKATDEDDSFDAWNDFTSSPTAEDPSNKQTGQTVQFEVTALVTDGGKVESTNTPPISVDWVKDDELHNKNIKISENKTIDVADDSFDDWNDFTSSTTAEDHSNKQTDRVKQFEVTSAVKDGGKVESADNSSSVSVDWAQEDQMQSNSIKAPDSKAIGEEDDLFDTWNDFPSSTTAQDPSNRQTGQAKKFEVTAINRDGKPAENANSLSSTNVDWFQSNEWKTNGSKAPENRTIDVDGDLFDAWNDFTSSTSALDPSREQTGQAKKSEVTTTVKDGGTLENAGNSTSIALIQDDQSATSSNKTPDNKKIDEGNDIFDTWNDFTSSTSAHGFPNKETSQAKQLGLTADVKDHGIVEVNNSSFDWFQGNEWKTSSKKAPDSKAIDEGHDSFDVWSDFASSTSAQNPSSKQSVNRMKPSVEQPSEMKFLATNNKLQDIDCGSLSQPHSFSGTVSDQNGSTVVNIIKSEPSVLDRVLDVNAKDEGKVGEATKGGNDSGATTSSTTNDIEMLMSQMHDLSFMLESNLSIPPKRDEVNKSKN